MKGRRGVDSSTGLARAPLLATLALALAPVALALVISVVHISAHPARPPAPVSQAPTFAPGPPAVFRVVNPPTDRPLMWFEPGLEQIATTVRLHAVDWHGTEVGSVEVPCARPCMTQISPDGHRLLVGEEPADGQAAKPASVFDTAGRWLGSVDGSRGQWSDDSRHLCVLRAAGATPSASGGVRLDVVDSANGSTQPVASFDGPALATLGGWQLLSCSPAADRAVVALTNRAGVERVRVVELSTGRSLYARDDPGTIPGCQCGVASLEVSHDGSVAVENLAGGGVQRRDLLSGDAAPLPRGGLGQAPVWGLSWNGRRAINDAGITDVTTGDLLWHAPPRWTVRLGAAEPAGDDVMVLISPSPGAERRLIVHADGTETEIPIGYEWPFARMPPSSDSGA